jgi:pimeloyl-ACP methyl ester carboxylesterase
MKRKLNLIMTLALTLTTWSLRAGVNPQITEAHMNIDGFSDVPDGKEASPGAFIALGSRKEIKCWVNVAGRASLSWASTKIEVYDSATGGTPLPTATASSSAGYKYEFDATPTPRSFFIKGVAVSSGLAQEKLLFEALHVVPYPHDISAFTVLKVELGVDGNRDGDIDFDDTEDKEITFWLNDDQDVRHNVDEVIHPPGIMEEDDVEVTSGNEDFNDNYIGNHTFIGQHSCKRDLEDFSRIHLAIEPAALLDDSNVKCYLRFAGGSSGTPSINIFEAVGLDASYLEDEATADSQRVKKKIGNVGTTPLEISKTQLKAMVTSFGGRASYLFEGAVAGERDLEFYVEVSGTEVCKSSVHLVLKTVTEMFERFTVGDGNSVENPAATPSPVGSFAYSSPSTVDDQHYILLVHGWNMAAWEKDAFAATAYKRLWWRGYKGRFGLYRWPTKEAATDWGAVPPVSYNPSEFRAWRSAVGLRSLLTTKKSDGYKVYVIAHSMGNVVVGEALRQYGVTSPSSKLIERYIATQAAVPTQMYDQSFTDPAAPWTPDGYGPETPNTHAHYCSGATFSDTSGDNQFSGDEDLWEDESGGSPLVYDDGTDKKLYKGGDGWTTADGTSGKLDPNNYFKTTTMQLATPTFINFFNPQDYALRSWWTNNRMKPDGPTYDFTMDHGFERDPILGGLVELLFEGDRYEIFAYCMESRVRSLGASASVGGAYSASQQVNLMDAPYNYEEEHPGHSKQFRNYIQQQRHYWQKVLDRFGL